MQGHGRLDVESAIISDDKIRRRMTEIDGEPILFENRKNVQLPKARIERLLKFKDELTVTVLESPRPIVQYVPIVAVLLGAYRTEIWVPQGLADNGREEVHSSLRLLFCGDPDGLPGFGASALGQ